jgi:two-component system, NtrC family, response regulator AtoC
MTGEPDMPALGELRRLAARAAATRLPVLILGETGVGKDVLASWIHACSPRAPRPLVRINCAALSESLLESELFGHEKGAFSGAAHAKPGLLETADGGTFFLDEIGDMPLALQPKLLRVLEDREVLRVGGLKARPIDVRFIAATNTDLERAVERGAFRADLMYRLEAIVFTIPPLRDRRGDIPRLAAHFAERAASELGAPVPAIDDAVLAAFARHDWPGNVRELRNAIERAVALGCGERLGLEHLPEKLLCRGSVPSLVDELERLERRRIVDALSECHGNQTKAALLLGLARTTLIERLRTYNLPRPRSRVNGRPDPGCRVFPTTERDDDSNL